MNRIFPALLLLLLTSFSGWTQTDDYEPVRFVNAAGDTVSGEIKLVKDYRYQKSVSILTEGSETPVRYTPKEISWFRFEEREFVTVTLDGKKIFMERIIQGELELYLLTSREKKGGKSVTVETWYTQKNGEPEIVELTKSNFRKEIGKRVQDNSGLFEKVDTRFYEFSDKEAVIEEYNQWVKLGKPNTTWTKEDGNNTHDNRNTESSKPKKKDYDEERYGERYGLEIGGYASYSFVNYDDQITVAQIFPSNGGFGYRASIGARVKITPTLSLKAGFQAWNKRFNINFLAQSVDTPLTVYNCTEHGNVHYLGMYAKLEYEFGRFFMNAGFDFSFANIYSGNYRIALMDNTVVEGQDGSPNSIVARKFNNQFDFSFGFGYKIPIQDGKYSIKPVFNYTMPLISVWNKWTDPFAQIEYYNYSVSAFLVQLGVIFDIGFGKKAG